MADSDFSAVAPVNPVGPSSNTGQKGAPIVDALTVIFRGAKLSEWGLTNLGLLLSDVFGFRGEVEMKGLREKRWQFYQHSAYLVDREGEIVGRVGVGGNGDSVCISMMGAGCRWVKDWSHVQRRLTVYDARISRCDIALDDYQGELFGVHGMRQLARERAFMQGGTPPKWQFIDDEGCGTGSTLYVGTKGHKQLCIYEKGKQLGHKVSPWVRCELRLYAKHGVIQHDVLTDSMAYLRGSYDVIADMLRDWLPGAIEVAKVELDRRKAEATGEAMVEYLHRQVGPSLHILFQAFGGSFEDFLHHRIVREGSPARFRGHIKGDALSQYLREELCRSAQLKMPSSMKKSTAKRVK